MAALDFPASPSDGDTYTPSNSAITYTFSSSKGSWQGSLSGTSSSVPTTITLAATNTTSATHYLLFASAATGDEEPRTDTGLTYNPGTNILTAVNFAGDLTGDVTGNASGTAATVTNATQAAITTLSNLVTTGALDSGSITSGFGTINTGSSTITTTGAISGGSFVVPNDGDIGSTGTTDAMQISSGGIVTFKDDILIKDGGTIGVASSTSAITIASTGIVTFVDDIIVKDAGTIGSSSDPDAIAIGSDGDVTLTQDLELQHDGAILSFGANDEIALTHVHDTGLALTDSGGTPTLQFHDSNESVSSDGTNLILTSGGTSFKIPTADGSNNHVLKTDGAGNLSFVAQSGGGASVLNDLTDVAANITNFGGSIHIATDGAAPVTGTLNNALNNIIIGADDKAITSGDNNIMLGNLAGSSLTTASNNILIGASAGTTIGASVVSNIFIGALAGDSISDSSSSYNVGIGYEAIKDDSGTVSNNVGIGYKAGRGNSGASSHDYGVYIGYETGLDLEDAQKNVFIGYRAGYAVTGGDENIFIGNTAGESVTTGSNNVIIGDYSGSSSMAGEIHLYAGTNERISVNSSGVVQFNNAYTFPSSDGSNGEVLQTNGSGTLSFASVGGGSPGGSNGQLQYNNSGSFGGTGAYFTFSSDTISSAAGIMSFNGGSVRMANNTAYLEMGNTTSIRLIGTFATDDPSTTGGMHWYDSSYYMYIRPKAWADNNDGHHAINLPTWSVDLNMFSQRNKVDLGDKSITHNTSNGKYIYILTDEYARTNHSTSSDKFSILIGHDVERGTNASSSDYNISMGYQTTYNVSGGTGNINMGYQAAYGSSASGGSRSIYLGYQAGYTDTDNSYNIGIGDQALYGTRNSSSNYNIGIGYKAYYQEEDTASQEFNIAIGYQAGYGYGHDNNSYRSYNSDENIAIGRDSMYHGFPGHRNISIGKSAMYVKNDNQSQLNPDRNTENIAIGYEAMYYMKSHTNYGNRTPSEFGRQYNVALGYQAGRGYDSTSEGLDAFGVYIGYEAGYNIRGLDNVDSDTSDQYRNTRGSKNVFIGYRAGKDVTFGKGNVIIGGHTGTAGTNFNNEVHIYAGDTERMKIDSSGLSVNGAAIGGSAPSHTSFGFDNFRGQDNCNARLSHRREEANQEDYPSTSSKFLNWGWYNASVSGYVGNRLFIVPAVGDSGSVVVYDDDTSTYGKQSFTWADVEGNHNNNHGGLYVDVSNVAMNVYLSYRSGQSASDGQRWRATVSTNNPQWDSTNGIWKSSDSGSDYNGTWIGTYSGEDNATRDSSHYNAWQPQGPISSNDTPDYTSKPACTSYANTYHFRERIIERDSQHGHAGSYWQDSAMPPGAQGNSTTAGDWIVWESTSTSWSHVFDNYQFGGGSEYWTGDLHFHPRFDTRIEVEAELYWMTGSDSAQQAWAIGAIIGDRDYYSNSWGTGTSGFQWLTDYADKDKYHGSRHSGSHSNGLNYTKLSRTLHVNAAANQSNYQWNCREATDRKPWTIGVFNKMSSGTVYLKQFRLKAKYYA